MKIARQTLVSLTIAAALGLTGGTAFATTNTASNATATSSDRQASSLAAQFDWWLLAAGDITSRTWVSNQVGWTNIKVNNVYDDVPNNPCSSMNFRLERWNGWFWSEIGTQTANRCDGPDDLVFHTSGGEYRFVASPARGPGGPQVDADGIVYYP
ncbi:hypothetical protein [Amycolatopsis nigrescens]|uniref:hypothetical protein n=1 Tax=Amycolatopsis nigrescens TaxID=381445 RepID=UPI0012F97404|nr:hypothetical protein [Amycolatopsis nigrescens]